MSINEPYKQVWTFHETYGLPRSRHPSLPSADTTDGAKLRELRRALMAEEYGEYLEAEEQNDLVGIADALGDMIYIAYGSGIAYGLPMDEIMNEIQRSNMSKLGRDGKPIYREDGKVLKGPDFTPPDIAAIVRKHMKTVEPELEAAVLSMDDDHPPR